MAPAASITEVTLMEKPYIEDPVDCKLTPILKRPTVNNNIEITNSSSVYDQTVPKNDPKFMHPVREWEKCMGFVTAIRWTNVFIITLYHLISVAAFFYYVFMVTLPKWQTVFFGFFMGELGGFGVTGGVHRYWCHKSFKAKLPLQIVLLICYSVAGQNTVYEWVRDHRVHHKFSETSADPHDARRGLFFSHVGWLMMKKHPDVLREGSKMDMSDVANDPLVRIHTKYFNLLKLLFCFILPTLVPVYGWNECWAIAIISQSMVRYIFTLNCTWSVNSFAHMFGNKPYDRHIMPAENWVVSIAAMGEGWHNYHHTFPWDYKAAELAYTLNLTTLLLDGFAKIGWAYDMKVASESLVRAVANNKGDKSLYKSS